MLKYIFAILRVMAKVYDTAFFKDKLVPIEDAQLNIASSSVLYGLSVYTVFPILILSPGFGAFRLRDHYNRLIQSARIIGIDTFEQAWSFESFVAIVTDLVKENNPTERVFVRATIHVDALVAGTRSRGLSTALSLFMYEASSIIPQDGARLKTSVWRRVPDYAIPSRAKVNGAYVNSVLAKQDALDSGYDDCIFLDTRGHVCELSAANIFLVRNGVLITPDSSHDLLEGINRRTILEVANDLHIPTEERAVDLTELYIADEVFACGTSAFVAPVTEIDARVINEKKVGDITQKLKDVYERIMFGEEVAYMKYIMNL